MEVLFRKLDLKWGYHQIELAPESSEITTFSTHFGIFMYTRLMFGMNCEPEMYHQIISQLFQGCSGVCSYLNNIVVFVKNKEEHNKNLKVLLQKLKMKGLTLNEECQFGLKEVVFLAHHIRAKGIRSTEDSQKIIHEFRRPHNETELRTFLGLINFSVRFIPNYYIISKPLRKLTHSTEQFTWGPEQEETFALLK
jgi:hypothetical protein